MAKWHGVIGFAESVENEPGIWREEITERKYFGELVSNGRRLQNAGGINDDVIFSDKISVISDPYANQKFYAIRYIEVMGTKWKVSDVNVQYPRLILSMGGVYNEE